MKSVITVLIMAAALMTGGVLYSNQLYNISERLLEINGGIEKNLTGSEFDEASDGVDELYNYLDEKEPYFEAFGDHEELDKIKMNMAELEKYIDERERTDALAKVNVLDFLFEHLPKNYRVRIENIL